MEQQYKQRIIGAVVIVALAVIFLPMLLRGPVERSSLDMPMEIPPRPDSPISGQPADRDYNNGTPALERIPVRSIDRRPESNERAEVRNPESEDPVSAPELPSQAPEPVAEPDEVPEPPEDVEDEPGLEPATEPDPEPEEQEGADQAIAGFAVQVGSFRNQSNAMGLRNRLRDQEYAAFVEEATAGGSPIYRLRVGPVIDRSEAEELARDLRQNASLDGLIVSHP